MKEFLEYVVYRLIQHPEQARIYDSSDDSAIRFRLELESEDVGLVVGRGGHTISAIRNLLSAAVSKKGKRVHIEVLERVDGD